MGIFELKSATVRLVVRAKCLTCARNLAADNAGEEGPRMWRDYAQSVATVQYNSAHPQLGTACILERKEI